MSDVVYLLRKPEKISTPIDELIFRLNLYAEIYALENKHQKLFVLLSENDFRKISKPKIYKGISFLEVKSSEDNRISLVEIYRVLKENRITPKLFIPNDPFRAFYLCYFLKLLFFRKSKLQLQLHGVISGIRFFNMKSLASTILLNLAIFLSNNIRVVSATDFAKLNGIKFLARKRIFLAPIPIYIPENRPTGKKSNSVVSVAILGRIHEERGIKLLIEIIHRAYQANSNLRFHIVGSGPSLDSLLAEVSREMNNGFCFFYGQKTKPDAFSFLASMDVLLNCAPLESYGLAMREALVQGTPIVALRNDGTETLKAEFPKFVTLFSNIDEAIKLLTDVLPSTPMTHADVLMVRKRFSLANQNNIKAVAQSWIY